MFKRFHKLFLFTAVMMSAGAAFAQSEGEVRAPAPRVEAAPFRIIPAFGVSSFANSTDLKVDRFDEGFSAGIFGDFGSGAINFETGIQTLQATGNRTADTTALTVQSWGIPLLAKLNFSGNPHSTVFAKAGVMPFNTTGDVDAFNLMGVGGIGGHIPLGRNSSLLLDATYNRLFTNNGELTNYQGIALLAGLSFNL